MLIVLVPLREAEPPKFKRSAEDPLRSKTNELLFSVSPPEVVMLLVAPSRKLRVAVPASKTEVLEDRAFAPSNRTVPEFTVVEPV